MVLDWALAAQLVTQGIAGLGGHLGQSGGAGGLAGRLAAAAVVAALGEALRRGVPAARWVQIGLCALLTLFGVLGLAGLAAGHGVGRGRLLSLAVLVTFAPFVVWRLALPRTAAWFRRTRGAGGAPRLSGPGWVTALLAWSAAWGVAVAWSQSLGR
ncbi:MAG: hypothetical protein QOE72_963 [Chloroflexota bacterium]|nr:hypothetical protein [Chloroflexota bacterium]